MIFNLMVTNNLPSEDVTRHQELLSKELPDGCEGDDDIVDRARKKVHGRKEIKSDYEDDNGFGNRIVFH